MENTWLKVIEMQENTSPSNFTVYNIFQHMQKFTKIGHIVSQHIVMDNLYSVFSDHSTIMFEIYTKRKAKIIPYI